MFFYYNFSLGKDNKKISMSQYTLTWGLSSIKRPRKYLSLFQRYCKLEIFVFFTPFDYNFLFLLGKYWRKNVANTKKTSVTKRSKHQHNTDDGGQATGEEMRHVQMSR